MTISHLRFGDEPIRAPYYINKADFVACHVPAYIVKAFPMVRDVKDGGVFLINCQWTPEELDNLMPLTRPSRSAWASAPTPSSSPLSSSWPT